MLVQMSEDSTRNAENKSSLPGDADHGVDTFHSEWAILSQCSRESQFTYYNLTQAELKPGIEIIMMSSQQTSNSIDSPDFQKRLTHIIVHKEGI